MLIHSNSYLRHEIFGAVYFCKRDFFLKATKNIVHSLSCLDAYEDIRLGLRYKNLSSQVTEKMGSNGIFQQNLQELPISSYEMAMEALSSLITRQKRGDKSNIGGRYGKLDRMLMYIKILGLEEQIAGLKIIHVAGTKGKGSTCVFCEAILRECGFRTGLFTSPHLVDVRERFRINGFDISEDKFLEYFWDCWNQLKNETTEDLPMPPLFQFLTVLAFKIFICEKVDVAVIEVGLGGKKDSTNVIKKPVVCGITSLGMDHIEALGNTLAKIALHKAGIMKLQIPTFTVPQLSEAMDVLKLKASELMVPLEVAAPLDPKKLDGLKLGLSGDHQLLNAGLAVALCRSWLHSTGYLKELFPNENQEAALPVAFLRGLSTAHLSGRAQIVYDIAEKANKSEMKEGASGDLVFYLDGAHSPESMEACARWFSNVVKEIKNPSAYMEGEMEESWGNGDFQCEKENFQRSTKMSKQILLFNCMDVRDPQILLPRLVNTCASSGVHFSKALFVPSLSTYNKVTSGASVTDTSSKDLSWQFTLQTLWEKMIHGKDVISDEGLKMDSPESLPSSTFLYEDPSQKSHPTHFQCSAVIPSLPLTIKWLRDCVKENPSVRLQVLVTGSLHLVGDVLKLLKR